MSDASDRIHRTLDRRYFTSEAIFDRETERIFRRGWIYVGRASRLAASGSYFLVDEGTESVIVIRGADGALRAFHNHCRHRGTCLLAESAGSVERHITCPYHAWSYALDGRLVGAPNMRETPGFVAEAHGLLPVALHEAAGAVFVNLAERPEPFERVFGSAFERFRPWGLDELVIVYREVYEVAANWKLIVQNYSECYHCPTVHPFLNELSPYRATSNDLCEGSCLGGPMQIARPGGSMTKSGERCAAPLPGVRGDDLGKVYYYVLFPNLFVSLHPDFVVSYRLERRTPRETRVTCEWLFHPSAALAEGFDPSGAVEFWDETNRQDWRVCALTQKGVSSLASRPGPYSSLESLLPVIDREYLRRLDEAR